MNLVCPKHIDCYQVDNGFLPRVGGWKVEVLDSFDVIFFYTLHCTLVRHVALSSDVGHRVQLQEYQVGLSLSYCVYEDVPKPAIRFWNLR